MSELRLKNQVFQLNQFLKMKIFYPYHECPSLLKCNAPKCLLDPDINLRNRYPNEEKCRAEKPTRFKIGSKYPELLPYQGLTKKEWLGKNMSEGERDKQRQLFLQRSQKWQKSLKTGIVEGV